VNEAQHQNNLWLFLEVLARRRSLILGLVIIVTLVAVIVASVLPKWYTATVLLLPPKEVTNAIPELSRMADIVSVTGGLTLPMMATPADVYVRMLQSRTVADSIIDRFNLMARYDTELRHYTYEALANHAKFRVTDEGLVEISFEDKDPRLAADVANAFVDELERVSRQITYGRARLNREFIEGRLGQVKSELEEARRNLEDFQMTHKTIDFDQQTRLAVEQAISLKVALSQTELELRMKEQTLSKDNAELAELRQKRDVTRGLIRQLEKTNPDSSFFSLPVSSMPALKGQYQALYSRVGVNESLYNLLLGQLEQAKIQENDRSSAISVLDRAQPPEVRSRPRRTLIVVGAFTLSLVFAALLAAFLEYFSRLRRQSPEDYDRAVLFVHSFLGWLPGIRRK
jgi:tyrosine-protein kinase Etk/Wzc